MIRCDRMFVEELLEECEELYEVKRDYRKVIRVCDVILKADSQNQKAMGYKAYSLYNLKAYDSALKVLDEAEKVNAKNRVFAEIRMCVLMKTDLNGAYEFYKASDDGLIFECLIERLAEKLAEAEDYKRALECYDDLFERNPQSVSLVEDVKRIMNKTDEKIEPKFTKELFMNWIYTIKSKSDRIICPFCGKAVENSFAYCPECERQLENTGLHIECDDMLVYNYASAKVGQVVEFLKSGGWLKSLNEEMDDLDESEFEAFINHLDDIEFIFHPSSSYIMLLDDSIKKYCDEGKYAAPRWLVYPELSAWTIGWRMGYGEDYAMNAPWYGPEFEKLFPMPKNWLFEPQNCKFKPIPLLGYMWTEDGKPKYSQIDDDCLVVNDFITMGDEKDFRHNHLTFNSVEHGILFAKVGLFHVDEGTGDEKLEDLKPVRFSDEEEAHWQNFKYTVCLNVLYYKIMQDEELKEWLLSTGDKSLSYISDDEWGGDENLFGFALMELRDEIRRLYGHEDLIDWKYTEYLKHKDPYENPKPRNPEDKQSAEYKVIESVINSASEYVRDINLDPELANKYEVGQIITERAFVDASSRIGGMVTTHRYLILSQWMTDFSQFDEGRNWGMHVAKRDSRFKVIDVYTVDGKTQIALLHLPDGFEEVFENTISLERNLVEKIRLEFEETLKCEPIKELATPEWLERCSFPLGMSDDGEMFK